VAPVLRVGLREWVEPEDGIGEQLKRRGFSPSDVRWALVTHSTPTMPAASTTCPTARSSASTTLTIAGDVHLLPTPGHTPGHFSVALEDDDTVFFFAGDASYTEQLMVDGVLDGVTTDVAGGRDSIARIQELVATRPTVYLPTHDPVAPTRLAARKATTATPRKVLG
jgi:hypothetical protein